MKTQESVSPLARRTADARFVADLWDVVLIGGILCSILALFYSAIATPALDPLLEFAKRHHWSMLWVRPTILWVSMGCLLMLMRTLLWVAYRPAAAVTFEEAPPLTVIVPAYNEGAMVREAITALARAHYPRERLQIIAIDDGSKDDTWHHISGAALAFPGLVTAIRLEKNGGKRAALAEGFRRARGEIVVSVDSDSVIEPDTLLAIAGPFRDARVGAVAGKVVVHNRHAHIIPRMLHVRFVLSFDFLRSAQSVYRTVLCCPGALTAYRMSAVRQVLDAWSTQTFLGVRSTYGEDRAMTNLILRAGYDSLYQRSAVVHTVVPQTYSKLCRMLLRWDRSYIREECVFVRSVLWRRPARSRVLAFWECAVTNLRFPIGYASMGLWAVNALTDPTSLVRMLIAIMVVSLVYALYFLKSERSWDFVFGVLYAYFSFFALTWIFPYAALTLKARGWLTR